MFVLVELRDTVTIKPADFRRKLQDAVTDALNRKFANKVNISFHFLHLSSLLLFIPVVDSPSRIFCESNYDWS